MSDNAILIIWEIFFIAGVTTWIVGTKIKIPERLALPASIFTCQFALAAWAVCRYFFGSKWSLNALLYASFSNFIIPNVIFHFGGYLTGMFVLKDRADRARILLAILLLILMFLILFGV